MEFSELKEFTREFKTLAKKFRSLEADLKILKDFLKIYPSGYGDHTVRISGLGVETEIYKVKHFRCQALKGKGSRSGIRIVYAYLRGKGRIEFTEIYYKEHDDTDCDKERIRRYY